MSDRRFGARPNPNPSPVAFVQHGITRRERVALARRDQRTIDRFLADYDATVRHEILALCDRWLAKHGSWEERHGSLR